MSKIIILGSGAAPGVPSLACGFGNCDPKNPKNYRSRSGTYIEINNTKFLIDTSPDLRLQLLNAKIKDVDAVFYTHEHADHLHGIDDLREINRINKRAIELYASPKTLDTIKNRFGYLIAEDTQNINPLYRAALHPNTFNYNESFYFKSVKVTPIKLFGHNVECAGYIFNDGEVVFIADFKEIEDNALLHIKRQPEVLIMPLTTPSGTCFHASLDKLLEYHQKISPKRMLINHMAVESDYNEVNSRCPLGVEPAFDGMEINWI
ncbi:MAG: MBL fold metallo-hydrolase [Alphaproteobacteria bacterium]|nr:MBL fold metallo-hydrolase [Alphaproteobacteria bacterium]